MISSAHRHASSEDLEPDDIVATDKGAVRIKSVSKTADEITILGVLHPVKDGKERAGKATFPRHHEVTLSASEDELDRIERTLVAYVLDTRRHDAAVVNAAGELEIWFDAHADGASATWTIALRPEVAKSLQGPKVDVAAEPAK